MEQLVTDGDQTVEEKDEGQNLSTDMAYSSHSLETEPADCAETTGQVCEKLESQTDTLSISGAPVKMDMTPPDNTYMESEVIITSSVQQTKAIGVIPDAIGPRTFVRGPSASDVGPKTSCALGSSSDHIPVEHNNNVKVEDELCRKIDPHTTDGCKTVKMDQTESKTVLNGVYLEPVIQDNSARVADSVEVEHPDVLKTPKQDIKHEEAAIAAKSDAVKMSPSNDNLPEHNPEHITKECFVLLEKLPPVAVAAKPEAKSITPETLLVSSVVLPKCDSSELISVAQIVVSRSSKSTSQSMSFVINSEKLACVSARQSIAITPTIHTNCALKKCFVVLERLAPEMTAAYDPQTPAHNALVFAPAGTVNRSMRNEVKPGTGQRSVHRETFVFLSNLTGNKRKRKLEKEGSCKGKKKDYHCTRCLKSFTRQFNLQRHMRRHEGVKPYMCAECTKSFADQNSLKVHMRMHTGEKPFQCQQCLKFFTRNFNLQLHMRRHAGEKPFKCKCCEERFGDPKTVHRHMLNIHPDSLELKKDRQCKVCGAVFFVPYMLKIHMKTHLDEKTFCCDRCGKACRTKQALVRHMHKHEGVKPHKCAECTKSFARQDSLKVHMRMHTGEQPFQCQHCPERFTYPSTFEHHVKKMHSGQPPQFKCKECGIEFYMKSHLSGHMKLHSGVKPFKCKECEIAFVQKGNLTLHMLSHTGQRSYVCKICQKGFTISSNLKIHMRIHTNERIFHCTHCDKSFTSASYLQTHIRIHTGDKPYQCRICKKAFSQSSHLSVHTKYHLGHKLFKCAHCSKKFVTKAELKSHLRTHTGDKPYSCPHCEYSCSQPSALKTHIHSHSDKKTFTCAKCNESYKSSAGLTHHLRTHT